MTIQYIGRKSHCRKAHLFFYLVNMGLHATLTRAHLHTSKTRRGGRHVNLVSTLSLTQCDPPPLSKNLHALAYHLMKDFEGWGSETQKFGMIRVDEVKMTTVKGIRS